jgi:hypothetical protein
LRASRDQRLLEIGEDVGGAASVISASSVATTDLGRTWRPGTTLFHNGRVRIVATTERPPTRCWCGGEIVASGDTASLGARRQRRRDRRSARRDRPAGSRRHAPAPHALRAFTRPLADLADATSHADIVARIAARAAVGGEWVMTTPVGEPHYFLRRSYRDLAEGALPTVTCSIARPPATR